MSRHPTRLDEPPPPPGRLKRALEQALAPSRRALRPATAKMGRAFPRYARRKWKGRILFAAALACVAIALIPLGSILYTAWEKGGSTLSPRFVAGSEVPPCSFGIQPGCSAGGIGPAVQGTLVLMGLASLWAIPVGIVGGIFLAEYGKGRIGRGLSFLMDVMSGIPSIVVGVFAYTLFLTYDKSIVFSAYDGGFALGVIMLPVITRTTEVSLRSVPDALREASWALGISERRTVRTVVLPSSTGPMVTGAILAAARVGGETAPLIFTAFGNRNFLICTLQTLLPNSSGECLSGPIGALGPLIYNDFQSGPYTNYFAVAWGAALVFILMMLIMSLAARLMLRDRAVNTMGLMGTLSRPPK